MAMIHEITEKVGKHKARKRIGRGPGSGTGKTAGKGHKGQLSRAGGGAGAGLTYEGGQMPYFRRIPKRGFNNANFRKEFSIVNLKGLEERFDDGAEVNPEMLVKVGLIHDTKLPVKVLGDGTLSKKLDVTAAKFSETAKQKIESAGGKVTVAG
jgi:large subunit ribosomal protein L15